MHVSIHVFPILECLCAGQRSVSSSIPHWTCFNWILGQQPSGIHLSLAPGFKTHSSNGQGLQWCMKFLLRLQGSSSKPLSMNFLFSTRDDNLMIEISFLLSQRAFQKKFSPPHVHLCGVTAISCPVEESRAALPRQKAFLRFLPLLCCGYLQPGAATSCFPKDKRDLCFSVVPAKTQL